MKNKTVKKYAVIMIAGVALNLGFYWIAHVFHLPAWLDTIGTAFAAVSLEPTAGLIIGYLTNLFESNAVYASNSIIYYTVGALCALLFGIMLRKNGRISWKRLPAAAIAYIITSSFLSAAITLWRTSIPNSAWETYFFEIARSNNIPVYLSIVFGAGMLKIADTIAICALLPILYKITPKDYKNEYYKEKLTWRSPFKSE